MELKLTLPEKTSTGKKVDIKRLASLINAGLKTEDAYNIILGSNKSIIFIDRVLYTPLTEKRIIDLFKTFDTVDQLKTEFKKIIINLYLGLNEKWADMLITKFWPEEEDNIRERSKTDDAITFDDLGECIEECTDDIKTIYTKVREVAEILFLGQVSKKWKKLHNSYDTLVEILKNIIEDDTPSNGMKNIADKMSLMSYSYEVATYKEMHGSRDKSVIEELLRPSKIHPSINMGDNIYRNDNNIYQSTTVDVIKDPLLLLTDDGDIKVQEDSFIATLRGVEEIEEEVESLDFITGED